jgi:ribosomal protein S13
LQPAPSSHEGKQRTFIVFTTHPPIDRWSKNMEFDPLEVIESAKSANVTKRFTWLNPAVAITVALLATFMGICKVKDDNIVQAMQQAQADKLDNWQFYQARNIREEIAKSTLAQLRLQALAAPVKLQVAFDAQIRAYEGLAKDQNQKKNELKAQAEKDQSTYDALNFKDDQFDLSDAAIAIAISLLAVTSLTQLPWLLVMALFPSGFGVLMGLAGLIGWTIHPDVLIKLLS